MSEKEIIYDIETGPLSEKEVLARVDPFVVPEAPGEFDRSAVKLGNTKAPDKVQAVYDKAEAEHKFLVKTYPLVVDAAWDKWALNAIDKAALSPVTGRVVAIGYRDKDSDDTLHVGQEGSLDARADEVWLLEQFWDQVDNALVAGDVPMIGFSTDGFDLPFLIKRSWFNDVVIPVGVRNGRYFAKMFVDLQQLWLMGAPPKGWSLDRIARLLGVGKKPDDMDGSMFAAVLESDRQKALDYLRNDLDMTFKVAERMGVV